MATHLLHDSQWAGSTSVISSESDPLKPIRIVREHLGKKVGVLNPHKNPSRALLPHFDCIKQIRGGVL